MPNKRLTCARGESGNGITVSYASRIDLALVEVGGSADGLDPFGIETGLLPCVAGRLAQVVVVVVGAVGPVVATEVVPEVFDGVEFGASRRQRDQRQVLRRLELAAGVEAGLIPEHHHVHIGIDLVGELFKEGVDGLGVECGGEQADGLAGLGTGGAQDVEVLVAGLFDRRRTRTSSGPLAAQRALLAEAGLVLEPELDPLAGMLGGGLRHKFGRFFLNASIAAGSFFSCRGRGISHS